MKGNLTHDQIQTEEAMLERCVIRFLKKHGINDGCCSSCHEDDDDGYADLLELYFTKKRMAFVCCRVHNAWDELVKQKPQYQKLEREF